MTEPLDALQVSQIGRALVTDLDTGDTTELAARPGSACLFFDRFKAGIYLIQLRLHWSDLDDHGHPRLDADFLDPDTAQHEHSMRGHPSHHTDSVGSGQRTYEWVFENVTRRFSVAITWEASLHVSGSSSVSISPTVIRAQLEEAQGHG